jgi:predicted amidophosphoribosyltransferase
MNIVQCTFCKKPFASVGGRICPACSEQIDRDFITVRDYIYDHKSSNIDIIAKETEVPKQTIIHLLKEGRLVIESLDGGEGGGVLFCEMCKKPINTGRLCKDCMGKVANKMTKNVADKKRPQDDKPEQNLKGSAKINT